MFSTDDHRYMSLALRYAAKGLYTTDPNPRVGCVIVKDNKIVGEGWHEYAGQAHAEINALNSAGDRSRGATAYVTLEPCSHQGKTPPCADALIKAGVKRVICASQDPSCEVNGRGIERLQSSGVEVLCGLLSDDAEALNPGFFSRMQRKRPFIRVKMAMSIDGRTALSNGVSQWISSPDARLDVQRWRARSSAIMTGINTVLADDPSLIPKFDMLANREEITAEQRELIRNPLRIILDSDLRIPLNSRLLQLPGDIQIVSAADDPAKVEALSSKGIEVVKLDRNSTGKPSLLKLMPILAEAQVNEIMVESGHVLAGALLRSQLIDELILYIAPSVLGDSSKGLFNIPILENMQARTELVFKDVRSIGPDLRVIAKPIYAEVA